MPPRLIAAPGFGHPALVLGFALGLAAALPKAVAAEPMGPGMSGHQHHHMAAESTADVRRSTADYRLPGLNLVRQDGTKVKLRQELDDGRPVILNFIYTSCTAICPTTSQVFSQVEERLGREHQAVHLVSISIDPEYDTPARLAAYARKFGAGAHWQFYTGSSAASIAVQKAFEAYPGDKMNHLPSTFLRAAPGKPWVRLDGFATPASIVREYAQLGGH